MGLTYMSTYQASIAARTGISIGHDQHISRLCASYVIQSYIMPEMIHERSTPSLWNGLLLVTFG